MISARPTENLTGVTIEGEFYDFYETVDSIHRITGYEESYSDPYWGVKNRLLGVCYDLRHAYQGDRDLVIVKNGVDDETLKWHSMIAPKETVHYSVNIIFPEAVFVAFSAMGLYLSAASEYQGNGGRDEEKHIVYFRHTDYYRDQANIDVLCAAIIQALGDVISDEEVEKMLRRPDRRFGGVFYKYLPQYIDKCNIEYLKTDVSKRKDKLRNIAKRILTKPAAYENMRRGIEAGAKDYGCSQHEMYDPKVEYPEDIVW